MRYKSCIILTHTFEEHPSYLEYPVSKCTGMGKNSAQLVCHLLIKPYESDKKHDQCNTINTKISVILPVILIIIYL